MSNSCLDIRQNIPQTWLPQAEDNYLKLGARHAHAKPRFIGITWQLVNSSLQESRWN